MKTTLALLLLVLNLCTAAPCRRIVETTICVPHQLYDLSTNSSRPTTVPFTLYAKRPVRRSPLVFILPGGLVLPSNYRQLSRELAHRGFIVAIPDYDQRPIPPGSPPGLAEHVAYTTTLDPPCPENGQFTSAALVSSFLEHVLSRPRPRWLLRKILVDRIILFGHSFGGTTALQLVAGTCAMTDPLGRSPIAFLCEGFRALPPKARVVGVMLFEGGLFLPFKYAIPENQFLVLGASKYYNEVYEPVLEPNGNLVDVRFSEANHFAPNDFTNSSMVTRCCIPRFPPEGLFHTDQRTQRTVVSSVASVLCRSYRVFCEKRDSVLLTNLPATNPRIETLVIA